MRASTCMSAYIPYSLDFATAGHVASLPRSSRFQSARVFWLISPHVHLISPHVYLISAHVYLISAHVYVISAHAFVRKELKLHSLQTCFWSVFEFA